MMILLLVIIITVANSHIAAHDVAYAEQEVLDFYASLNALCQKYSKPTKPSTTRGRVGKTVDPTGSIPIATYVIQYASNISSVKVTPKKVHNYHKKQKLDTLCQDEYSGEEYLGGILGNCKYYKVVNNRDINEEDDWGAEDWRRHSKHGNHVSKGQRKWIIETKARKAVRGFKYSYAHLYPQD